MAFQELQDSHTLVHLNDIFEIDTANSYKMKGVQKKPSANVPMRKPSTNESTLGNAVMRNPAPLQEGWL